MKVSCPKGWKAVDYREPEDGEFILDQVHGGESFAVLGHQNYSEKVILEPNHKCPEELHLGMEGFFGSKRIKGKLTGYCPDKVYKYYFAGAWFKEFVVVDPQQVFDLEIDCPRGYRTTEYRPAKDGEWYLSNGTVHKGENLRPVVVLEQREEFSQYDLGKRFKFSDFGQWWSEGTLQGILLGPEERTVFLDAEGHKWFICKRIQS